MPISRASFLALVQHDLDNREKEIQEMDTKIVEKVDTAKKMWIDSQNVLRVHLEDVKTEMLQLLAYPDVEPPSIEAEHRSKVKRELFEYNQKVSSSIANVKNAQKADEDDKKNTSGPSRSVGISL